MGGGGYVTVWVWSQGGAYADAVYLYARDDVGNLTCPSSFNTPTPAVTATPTAVATSTSTPAPWVTRGWLTQTPYATGVPSVGVTPVPTTCASAGGQDLGVISGTLPLIEVCLEPYQLSVDSSGLLSVFPLVEFDTLIATVLLVGTGLGVLSWIRKR